uniref:K Homology domain-containing protein n=1 Tax=Pavo cristatus TaxID=9049 RepID=A0A8C9G5R5_PAVCR
MHLLEVGRLHSSQIRPVIFQVESFILDQDDLENPMLETASKLLLSSTADGADLRTVDPETQARLEALLEAAGIGKLSTADGKAFADPEVLRRLTSSVSCALDEAAAALTRMRAESTANAGQTDNRSLAEACSEGDVNAVRKLLIEGRSVNEHTEEGESLLCLACSAGYYELAQVLLAMHANVEDRGIKGDITPLMAAANGGHVKIVKLLLAHGADVNSFLSVKYFLCTGHLEMVRFLLEAGADQEHKTDEMHTALMEACMVRDAWIYCNRSQQVRLCCARFPRAASYRLHLPLLHHLLLAFCPSGANVHATTATGDTALTYACENGHTDVADVLLQAGADLEHESEGGRTPLMKAARAGHVCTVQFLISKGANVNRTTANNDHTVLSLACAGGHLAVVELLLAHGADPTHRLKDGSTMLIEAAKGGHTSVVCYLLDYPNNLLSAPPPDATQLTPPSHDLNRAPRVPVQALPMVVPPQEPDKPPANVATTLPIRNKAASKQKSSSHLPANNQDVQGYITNQSPESIVEEAQGKLTELEQRIKEAIEKNAQLQSLELAHADQLTKEKIEELNKTREEQIQKKQKILEELQKVERELQLKTQQQLKKQYLEVKAQRIQLQQQQQQQSCQHLGLLTPVGVGEQLSEGDYARLQQVDPVLLKDDPQQAAAQTGFAPIQPLAMPQALPLAAGSLPPGSIANLTELQGVIVGQPVLGQAQLAGLGQGILTETQQGLMVASPAQTLNDTLDDIMAVTAVIQCVFPSPSIRAPAGILANTTESNHDTALTLACAGGHEELVQTLLERGANIEHRDKKGFTPLILAATAGHVGVVEILLDNGADIEAQSERTKDTPLSLACSGGRQEVKSLCISVLLSLLCLVMLQVNFTTGNVLACFYFQVLLTETRPIFFLLTNRMIILIQFLELAKLVLFYVLPPDDPEVPMEPPSATTTTTIGISATWTTLAGSHGKRNNTITTTSSKRKNRKNKVAPDNVQIIFDDQLPISYNQPEKVNGESKSSSTSESGDSDNMRISSCSDESSNSNSSHKSDNHSSTAVTNTQSNKKQPSVLVTCPKDERKAVTGKSSIKLSEVISEVTSNSLSTCTKSGPSPLSSPNGKLTIASPKRGQKREEGWKEVVRRSKKVSVPSTVISRVIGRGGCNINAIRECTGAHIDIDKQKDKTGDRIITIRGGTESTRQATQLINALIKDPDKEIDELIPKNRLKSSSANSKIGSSTPATTTAANSSLVGIKVTTVAASSTSQTASALTVPAISSASNHKTIKNPVNNVRPGFQVSLPLAYPPPQFAHALLAAQTFQQIRPPRLPMTHFGGTFPPAQSTWGPFPVRPLSPARATNSPKPHMVPRHNSQNSSGSQVNSASSLTTSPTATTSSVASTVPGSSANGSPSSPSVRRQLFVTVVKTSNATTTTVTTTASNTSTAATNATYPIPTAKEHYPASSPSSPSPPAQPAGVSRSSPSDCAATSPNKGAPSSDQEVGSPPAVETSSSTSTRQPSTGSASSSVHPAHQQPPGAPLQEARPPLQQPQVPAPDPRMVVPPNLAVTSSSAPVAGPTNAPMTYPMSQTSMGSSQPAAKMETPAIRPPVHGTGSVHKNPAPVQNSSVAVLNVNHIKRPPSVPSSVQLPSTLSTQSASQNSAHPANKSMGNNFSATLPFGPFSTLFENNPTSAHAFWGGSVVSSQTTPESMLSGKSSFLPNSEPLHQSDTSKAPGFRPPLQRPAPSPSGNYPFAFLMYTLTLKDGCVVMGVRVCYNTCCFYVESPAQSVSSGVRTQSPTPSAVSLGSEKSSNVSQDRKVPVPIGTERSARIRQTGTSTPSVIGSNLAAPVGHSGIWSFEGIGGNQDKVDWCHSGMGSHMIHRPMSDPGVFSHQAMERDSTGIITPSGTFHQPVPAGYMDFPKVGGMPFSVYGNAMIPPVAPITDGTGGPIFNGPHAADPSWNSLIKMVSNSTENNGPQTVILFNWSRHLISYCR